jgi:hypothetical protein
MSDVLFQYEKVNPTSWAYLSSILALALFFKFNRLFSIRNVDLLMLILLAPGLLLVQFGLENLGSESFALDSQRLGFTWLFAVGAVWLARLLADVSLVRRPLLPPNLNESGLLFLGGALLFFLMTNVVTGKASSGGGDQAQTPAESEAKERQGERGGSFETEGPGYWLVYLMPRITTQRLIGGGRAATSETAAQRAEQRLRVREAASRAVAIASNMLIVAGMIVVGTRHFDNPSAGVASATMYLLTPYTALWTGSVPHALPAALLVWAVACYRRPLAAGLLVGLASGTIYYPMFLLPLWCSFYWDRGVKRFVTGVLITLSVLVATLAMTAGSLDLFLQGLTQMFGIRTPPTQNLGGVWQFWPPIYRLPILALFVALAFSFAGWPNRKHLGTLISCSAGVMLAAQFWHAHGGGLYIAWYLPLLLLTVYRPNLEDRVAATMVEEGWWQRRRRLSREPAPTPAA